MQFKKILFILFLLSCGSGQDESKTLELESSGFNLPLRVEELDGGQLLVADAVTAQLLLVDLESGERKELALFDSNQDFSVTIHGLLVHRAFKENGFVYVYHGDLARNKNVLTRLTLRDEAVLRREVLSILTEAGGHNGGGMYQFNDGKILLGTGDHLDPQNSQDPNSLSGKLLLLDEDGELLNANYASGLRNPFGIAGDESDLFVIDNGPDCDDEINLVSEGANYGWRADYVCAEDRTSLFTWSDSQGTTDISYLVNKLYTSRYGEDFITVFAYDGSQLVVDEVIPQAVATMPFIGTTVAPDNSILFTSQDGSIYRLN